MNEKRTLVRSAAAIALAAGFVMVGGCGASSESGSSQGGDGAPKEAATLYAPEIAEEQAGSYAPKIDPADFVEKIDNPYFPLGPGKTFVFEEETEDGFERIEDQVTSDTREILGVKCVVLRDRVTLDGELIEDTLDWYAQDRDGNVWYFGEASKHYEKDGAVDTAGSWEAGKDGVKPGIIMEENPRVGDSYRQEYLKGEAEGMAEVLSRYEVSSVPHGSFDNVLLIKEWNPQEPEILEHKYYAPGVGPITAAEVAGGSNRVELVDLLTG
jgi:hypothetical protein